MNPMPFAAVIDDRKVVYVIETAVAPEINPDVLYAGFWKRVGAHMLDNIILTIAWVAVLQWVLGFCIGLFLVITGYKLSPGDPILKNLLLGSLYLSILLYYGFFESSSKQATLGKQVMKIVVVDLNYRRVNFPKAFLRALIMFIPTFIYSSPTRGLWLVVISLAVWLAMVRAVKWTKKRQGLHDIIAGCLVVNKDAMEKYFTIPDNIDSMEGTEEKVDV